MNTRQLVLEGKLEFPEQILDIVGVEQEVAKEMFQAIWYNFTKNKGSTSTTYWSDRFKDPKVFNRYVMHLSRAGWIKSLVLPKRHWAELSFNENKLVKFLSEIEVEDMRLEKKVKQYVLTDTIVKDSLGKTKTSVGIENIGIKRKGFQKSAKAMFQFDIVYLTAYREAIVKNVTKGIKDMDLDIDRADYKNVAKEVIRYYVIEQKEYCLNGSISDSRGRNIYKGLSKIFNPIGFKDARALLVTKPKSLGITGMKEVQLFVAELLSLGGSTKEVRARRGAKAIASRTLPKLDLETEEGRSELHELIWLERIYDAVNEYDGSNWTVPIELDFTASILAITGVLLGDYEYMDLTNIVGEKLKDAWTIEGVTRNMVKKAMTPRLYGSSETIRNLWSHRGLAYTEEQLTIVQKELTDGRFTLADKFKDFIIGNVETQKEMTVTVWNDTFTIKPNRYRNAGDYTKKYVLYCSNEDMFKTIRHTHTKRIADLDQFKLYFPTLLVHGVDSQIADSNSEALDWCIDIHDAFIVHPADSNKVKSNTVKNLNKLYEERDDVLGKFFRTTGINNKYEWAEIRKATKVRDVTITANVLK